MHVKSQFRVGIQKYPCSDFLLLTQSDPDYILSTVPLHTPPRLPTRDYQSFALFLHLYVCMLSLFHQYEHHNNKISKISLIGLFRHTVSCVVLEMKRVNVCVHCTCQRDSNVWTILLV